MSEISCASLTSAAECKPYQKPRERGTVQTAERMPETVLVIEDDRSVRNVLREMLERSGYAVMEACDGEEGVNVYKVNGSCIHLVLSDVIMPKKNGRQVYDEIKELDKHAKVLFMSGYPVDILYNRMIMEKGFHFIQKPMRPQELLIKIRELLDT
jgi:DNA-binding NtrC family response regulator